MAFPLSSPRRRIRFRRIFLLSYVVIVGLIVSNCVFHPGHSPYCKYTYYLLLPAGPVIAELLDALIPWNLIPSGPVWRGIEFLLLPIPFLATGAQYYLLGFLLDKFVRYRRRRLYR